MAKRGLGIAVVGIVVVISALTGHRLPLYDGVSAPDEPYRYVVAPLRNDSQATLRPTGATTAAPVGDGTNSLYMFLSSDEVGPQVTIYLNGGTIKAPMHAANVTVSVEPGAPLSACSADKVVAGNVYRFVGNSSMGAVSYAGTTQHKHESVPDYIDMRLPQGLPVGAVVLYRSQACGAWTPEWTTRVGNDVYETHIVGFGEYALSSQPGLAQRQSGGGQLTIIAAAVTIFFVAVVIILLILRYRGTRGRRHARTL